MQRDLKERQSPIQNKSQSFVQKRDQREENEEEDEEQILEQKFEISHDPQIKRDLFEKTQSKRQPLLKKESINGNDKSSIPRSSSGGSIKGNKSLPSELQAAKSWRTSPTIPKTPTSITSDKSKTSKLNEQQKRPPRSTNINNGGGTGSAQKHSREGSAKSIEAVDKKFVKEFTKEVTRLKNILEDKKKKMVTSNPQGNFMIKKQKTGSISGNQNRSQQGHRPQSANVKV